MQLTVHSMLRALALTSLSAPAWAGVSVLGKPQLGVFPTVQGAVDAAVDGDVLLVSAGFYPGFTITNESLTVMAESGAEVNIQGTCTVRDLSFARRVQLFELNVAPATSFGAARPALELLDNVGQVRAQGCTFTGGRPASSSVVGLPGGPGAEIARSQRVTLTRCMVFGCTMGFWSGEAPRAGGDGARSLDSAVAFYDCIVRGGVGSEESSPAGGVGGAGMRVDGWGVFAASSAIRGGKGGGGDYNGCTAAGNGGDGLVISEAQAQLFGTTIDAGLGTGYFSCFPGVSGARTVTSNAVLNESSVYHRSIAAPALVSDQSTVTLNIQGKPGDTVYLLVTQRPTFLYKPALSGVLAIPAPLAPLPVGVIGPSGTLSVPYALPDLQGPQPSFLRVFQTLSVDVAARSFLSSSIAVVVENT